MTYSTYTIIPEDDTVVLDGKVAFGVDMSTILPGIHAIQWYSIRGYGLIEPDPDPLTGDLAVSTEYTDYSLFQDQIDEAEAIIFAYENPQIFHSTSDTNLYQGIVYDLGQEIVVSTPNTPQPDFTTSLVPPTPEVFQELYWYEDTWVLSGFDPSLTLSAAQNFLEAASKTSAATEVNDQSRVYSTVQLVSAVDITALLSADYPTVNLGDYQTYIDALLAAKILEINNATTTVSLYGFDPNISGDAP